MSRSPDADRGAQPSDVVTVGETLACLVAPDGRLDAARSLTKTIGGSESNTAVGLVRLGRTVTWISRVGRDPFGDEITRTLRGEGVDVSHVAVSPEASTGLMVRERRSLDEIHVHYYRQHSAATELDAASIPEAVVADARRVHLTGITLGLGPGPRAAVHRVLEIATANRVPVSFDPNIRRKVWSLDAAVRAMSGVLPHVTDLLANEDEAMALAGADDVDGACRILVRRGIPVVVVKMGADGALGCSEGERFHCPAVSAPVIDTVGAGDAFNAGYLHARLGGSDVKSSVGVGAWVASRVVAHHGDYEGLPLAHELETWRAADRVVTR